MSETRRDSSTTAPVSPERIDEHSPAVASLRWALPMGLALATFLTFALSLRHGFVNWDDDVNLVTNTAYRGLGAPQLRWMFTTLFGGHYQPLTWLSYAIDYSVWGMEPFGYHLTNVVLHTLNVVLFYFVARRLLYWAMRPDGTRNPATAECDTLWGGAALPAAAGVAAAIFGLHPLRVESVAWVTERRDVLSAAFMFGCLLAWFRAIEGRRVFGGWFLLALVLFAGSLLSKAAAMGLPLVMLVIDVYPAGRLRKGAATVAKLVVEKLPFVALSVVAAVVAMNAQRQAGAWQSIEELNLPGRIAIAAYGFWFYPYKFLRPTELSPLYPLPPHEALLGGTFVVAGVACLILIALAVMYRKRYPAVPAVLLCYVAFWAPVSGLAQSGKQLVADRYSYLSLLPLEVLVGGLLLWLCILQSRKPDGVRRAKFAVGLAVLYVGGLILLTLPQIEVWRDSARLWRHALRVNPANSVAHVNLGEVLRASGETRQAANHYQRAVALDAGDAKAHNGLGISLIELGHPEAARRVLSEAVRLEPGNPKYRCNLAYVLAGFRELEAAAAQYRAALRTAPEFAPAAERLAALLIDLGEYSQAEEVLRSGLEHHPGHRAMQANLAWLLATCPVEELRDGSEAVELATRLCEQTDFQNPWLLDVYAAALAEAGAFDRAAAMARLAMNRAAELNEGSLQESIRRRMEGYEAGEAHRLNVQTTASSGPAVEKGVPE